MASEPAGLEISLGSESLLTPFTRTVLARSANQVSAAPSQPFEDAVWTFGSWSGGVRERGDDRARRRAARP